MTMIIDMHAHTAEHSSCSHVKAVELVSAAYAKHLHGVVFTDHHYLWTDQAILRLRTASGVPEHFLIFSGQEVHTAEVGDVLVYGAEMAFPPGTSLDEIRTLFPEAALVWAHPYREGKQPAIEYLLDPRLDGIEIVNAHHTIAENRRGIKDWHQHKFTAVGGSDIHLKATIGAYPTIYDHPLQTMAELAAELRQGRCRPFVWAIFSCERQPERTRKGSGKTVIPASHKKTECPADPGKWGSAARAYKVIGEMAQNGFAGGRYRVPLPLGHESSAPVLREEGTPAKLLYDLLLLNDDEESSRYHLNLAACWLARLHNRRFQISPPQEFLLQEKQRLSVYVEYFRYLKHPATRRVEDLSANIITLENELFAADKEIFVQGHGDFHLRSILIGQDDPNDSHTVFVEALGFDNSLCMPCAFDVGTFLAHYKDQLYHYPEVLDKAPETLFLHRYLAEKRENHCNFLLQVELFTARINLSIAHQLLKSGHGESDDLHRVLLEAESKLTAIAMDTPAICINR